MNVSDSILNHRNHSKSPFSNFTKFYISINFNDNFDQLRKLKGLNKIDCLFVNQ
jgi:hypothetical protein